MFCNHISGQFAENLLKLIGAFSRVIFSTRDFSNRFERFFIDSPAETTSTSTATLVSAILTSPKRFIPQVLVRAAREG
jgi:hypothetical protein